jgi:hypothetical protein
VSEPQRRQVRVRRSPKIGVFLAIGAVLGALVAVVAVNVTPADATVPKIQAIGFLILLLAPVGALLAGVLALVLDRIAERSARTVDAELISEAPAPVVEQAEPDADRDRPDLDRPDLD